MGGTGARGGARRVPEPPSGRVVPGRFPLLTDENIDGPIIRGSRQRGWDVQHATKELGEETKKRTSADSDVR